jgi:N,N'-diacetyllegionaminate synthase
MSDLDEVAAAIEAAGDAPVALLHCVSSYPTPPEQANLRAIATLRDRFGGIVGYSDHCLGLDVSLAAVALGAEILERHVTLDRSAPGPDHAISLLPGELAELVRRTRLVESALGDGTKRPQPAEADTARVARRSLVAGRDLTAGEVVDEASVAIKRPGDGLQPNRRDDLVGVTLRRSIARDEPFLEEDLT